MGINAFGNETSPAIFSMVSAEIDFINEAKCRGEATRKALYKIEKSRLNNPPVSDYIHGKNLSLKI